MACAPLRTASSVSPLISRVPFQAAGHEASYTHVHVPPFDAGACDVQYVVMASLHDAVNIPLAGGKPAVDGSGARIVRAIVSRWFPLLRRKASAVRLPKGV